MLGLGTQGFMATCRIFDVDLARSLLIKGPLVKSAIQLAHVPFSMSDKSKKYRISFIGPFIFLGFIAVRSCASKCKQVPHTAQKVCKQCRCHAMLT